MWFTDRVTVSSKEKRQYLWLKIAPGLEDREEGYGSRSFHRKGWMWRLHPGRKVGSSKREDGVVWQPDKGNYSKVFLIDLHSYLCTYLPTYVCTYVRTRVWSLEETIEIGSYGVILSLYMDLRNL